MKKHAHVELAEVQREQGTLLCPGPCPHIFKGRKENRRIYGEIKKGEVFDYYDTLLGMTPIVRKKPEDRRFLAGIMAGAEKYTKMMLRIWVELCGIRTFKDQDGIYQEWGPPGDFMMMRVLDYVRDLEKELGVRIIYQHDCKRGDLAATQSGYYGRFLDDLWDKLRIKFSYLPYDTMNITVYMGSDVALLEESKKKNPIPPRGLKVMRKNGKAIVVVDKTSNDSGPEYQQLFIPERGMTLEKCVAEDVHSWAEKYTLIYDELSSLGLVVGSTHPATGKMRALAPTETFWVPGFGNQGGKFENIMLELIREGKWNGQGAIFGSETGMMYVWRKRFGGTGRVSDAEKCAKLGVENFKKVEHKAFQASEVKTAGIQYPF